jgi:hypothetical protein
LTGCAAMNKPSAEQLEKSSSVTYPDNYKKTIEAYFKKFLVNPDSIRLSNWIGPSKGYFPDMSGDYFGYRVCVDVNSKNRAGADIGLQQYVFLLNGTYIVKSAGGYKNGTYGANMVAQGCNF